MSGAANPYRGEAALLINGAEHILRPSFSALVAAEEELGPLLALVERASAGELRLSEIVALFWHCLRDRAGLDRSEFADGVSRLGLAVCAPILRCLLVQVLKGAT